MKRKFVKVMFFGALALSTVTYVGCKDYDDDIDNLQTQIDAVKVSLEELQAKVKSGSVITDVVKGENGITVTLSDGKSYELTNGKNGTDADVWTIGEKDGYWYKNNVKTEYKAVGVDGVGSAGPAGSPGANGKYYVPNKETGNFDIYQDGKFVEATDISWKSASEGGMTAVLNGNVLTLQGVEGAEGDITIDITSGIALSSVAFIPDVVSTDLPYATTSTPFYHIKNYLDEAKYDETGALKKLADWGKSNVVALNYRLNPEDANVDKKTVFSFIDRKVKTRAAGDRTVLLNVDGKSVADGVVTIGATINPTALAENPEYNIAALQAWYGQKPLTSDYVYATSTAIDLVLADSVKTKKGDANATIFYNRTKSILVEDGESSDFIKQFVTLEAASNVGFKYNSTINLKDYVGLYSNIKTDWLAQLGFKGMSYEFTIPKEYLAADDERTNQQWFIVKEGEDTPDNGVIKVNPEVNGLTPAIGRTPVVRVDAYLLSNGGVKKLVASSYIKLEITEVDPTPGEKPKPIKSDISTPKFADYHQLEAGESAFDNEYLQDNANMGYKEINNQIYGAALLTSTTFWNYYGGKEAQKKYNVSITVLGKNDEEISLLNETIAQTDADETREAAGVVLRINLNSSNTTTSAIKVGINDKIKTQQTKIYKDVDGKGAQYTVKLTIPANDDTRGDVVLTQIFYVKEVCVPYEYNENYYFESYGAYKNCIVVKGQVVDNHWEMSSKVAEHFALKGGKNIFEYYNTVNNVNAISFQWTDATGVTPANPFSTNEALKLSAPMNVPEIKKEMNYTVTLNNGEECKFTYNVLFVNPFVAGKASLITINGNAIGTNTGETKPQVKVLDNAGKIIYSYVGEALTLSKDAVEIYKLVADIVSVNFAPIESDEWLEFKSQLTEGSQLDVNAESGTITWKNEGTTLAKDLNFTVRATVTFKDLSVVTCDIPVKLAK